MQLFGNGMFGLNNQNAMDQMKNQIEYQLMQYLKMKEAQQQQQGNAGKLEEFKNVIISLTQDEQLYLVLVPEFVQAKLIYDSGFIDFLGALFANDYLATPVGKQAIENLIDVSKNTIKTIKDMTKERNLKLEALAALAAEDPEILKKLQEKLKSS